MDLNDLIVIMQGYIDNNVVEWEVDETGCLRLLAIPCPKNSVKPTETAHVARVGKVIKIEGVQYHMEKGDTNSNCYNCKVQWFCRILPECKLLGLNWMCVKIVKPTTDEGEK